MFITPITNYTFQGSITPVRIITKSRSNKKHPFLYNEVLDITRKERIAANFNVDKIDLPSPTKGALAMLKARNIKYIARKKQPI